MGITAQLGAKARHRLYIGKLLRRIDVEPIQAALARRSEIDRQRILREKSLEQWRDRLLADEAAASKTGGAWCVIGEREGKVVTFNQRLKALSEKAAAVVAAGTCASWGGIPHGKPNPTGAKGLLDHLGEGWHQKHVIER